MKLSTKIILPIIIISALLILLAGCFGVPSDESPGFTPGTITGIIAAPCCSLSADPVSETCCIAPEYWCYYCQEAWSLQDGVEVILTYGEDEVATTTTNEFGEYTFANVSPGKNYVVTAYCPDYDDDRPLVKDVALELVEGGYFDTKITDIVSTSLGLVVDFLVDFTILGPEDIVLDDVIADKPDFKKFPKFRKLITEVIRVLEVCQDVNADDDLQYALCRAAEEISGLNIGCGPGYTPPLIVRYTLTTAANPPAGGTVSGAGTYTSGTVVPVTASPAIGWSFTSWSGDLGGNTNPTSITMNSNKGVTGNFSQIDYTLTIDYEYEDTTTAATSHVETLNVGDPYSVLSPVIPGYTASQLTVSGTMPADDVTVLVVYTAIDYTLTIDYEYEDTTTAATSHVETLNVGDPYSVLSPVIPGYTASQLTVSGTMPADDVTVLVVYTAIDYTLTIDYEYEDTTTAATSHVETLNVGDPYSVLSPVIPGYTASQLTVSGTMPADDVTVLVVYTAIDYTLTIDYEYEDTTTAATSHVETLNVGDPYSVLSPVIPGYTASQLTVSGTMPADDVTVLVVYTAIDYTLTIDYEYEDTTTAATSHVETLNVGDPYSVLSPVIPGYTASQLTVSGTMPADDVTVLVVYTAIDYTLTIDYEYEDTTTAATSHVETLNVGDPYSVLSPVIPGYTASQLTVSGTMPADDVTVLVVYTAIDYTLTIDYEYEDTTTAATSHVETLNVGDPYSVLSPVIPGYTASQLTVSGTMPADDVTVLVVYTAIDYTLTIDYEYEDTTTAATSHVETLNVGDPYSVLSPVIPGYTASQLTVSGTMPADDVTVLVVYTAIDYTLTIDYEYEDTTTAATSHVETLNVGDPYSVLSPVIPGYTASQLTVSGTMPADDVTVLVVYTAIDYTLTIDYEYEDTTTAATSHVETLNVGDPYSVLSPVIPGYTASQLTVSGTMPADDVTVLVVYTAIDYTLTIDYEYEDTTTAATSHVETLNVGDPYSVLSPVIPGYTASQLTVSGTMPADDVTVLVVYTAIDYTLTIDYEYEDTTTAATSHVETLNVGDPYSVLSPVIPGYTASQLTVSGTMPADDVTVLVVYTAIDYTLTIDYEYEDTTTAATSHVETLNVGDPYSVLSPVIPGYTASQLTVSGTMPADDVTVLVVYTAIDYTLTIDYEYEDTTTAATSHVETLNVGDPYSVLSPVIPGYTASQLTVSGTMPADDVTVLVVYTAIDYTLTIDYEYEDTTTAATSHVETLNVGDPYSVLSPVIPGYTASQLTVSGTMPADDVTVLVVYTAIDYTLTIDYEYEDTTTAATSHVETLNMGSLYSVDSPLIAEYTADRLNVSGIMPADDVTETVTYVLNPCCELDAKLTVNSIEWYKDPSDSIWKVKTDCKVVDNTCGYWLTVEAELFDPSEVFVVADANVSHGQKFTAKSTLSSGLVGGDTAPLGYSVRISFYDRDELCEPYIQEFDVPYPSI